MNTNNIRPSASQPSWHSRLPFYYGWLIVSGFVVTGAVNSSFYWLPTLFLLPMQEELGWSRTSILAAITIRGLVGAFISPFVGALLDRRGGAIRLSIISGVVGGASIMPIAWVTEEWQFLALYGLIGGISQVGQAIAVLGAILPRWFIHKRGSAMTTATLGAPLGAFCTPLIVGTLINLFGWRPAWMLMGGIVLILGLLPAFLFHRQPEDIGLQPDGGAPPRPHGVTGPWADTGFSLTAAEALKTRTFWVLTFATTTANFATSALPASLVALFVDRGAHPELAILGISLHGLVSMLTRFVWGWATNRFPIRRVLLCIAIYGSLVCPLPFFLSGDALVLYGGIIAVGIGGFVATNQLLWPAYFGRAHLGAITGFVRPFQTGVASLAPLMVPFLYERTGDYNVPIAIVTVAWMSFAVLLLLIPKVNRE